MGNLLYKIYTLIRYYPRPRIRKVFKDKRVPELAPQSNLYRNIIFCPFNPHQLNIIREGIWAHACELRGANVKMLTYDLDLPAIDFLPPGTKKDIKVSYWIVMKLFRIMGLTPVRLSDFARNETLPGINFRTEF